MGSAGVARADPSYVLTGPETQARAGDLVHFTISGTHKHLTYALEIGDTKVAEGSAGGNLVSGQFTLPDLGEAARTVTLEAELGGPGKKKTTTVRRELRYLGPALAAGGPPEVQPVALPVVQQPAVSAPVIPAPPAAAPAVTRRSHGTPPRRARKRHTVKRRLQAPRSRGSTHRKQHSRDKASGTRAKGPAPRTAPLFDGVPEPGSRSHPLGNDAPGLKAIVPPTAALTVTGGDQAGGGGSAAAILIPGLLGLAALSLTGATLLRRRRTR
jgi:hypothetical protein